MAGEIDSWTECVAASNDEERDRKTALLRATVELSKLGAVGVFDGRESLRGESVESRVSRYRVVPIKRVEQVWATTVVEEGARKVCVQARITR